MPCGRPMRATTTSIRRLPCLGGSALVDVEEVHPHAALEPERTDHGAQGLRGAAVAADHLAEVVGVHAHLETAAATVVAVAHGHVVGVLDDAPDQVLESVLEHRQPSSLAVSASGAGVVSSAAGAASASATGAASASLPVLSSVALDLAASPLPALRTSPSAAASSAVGRSAAGVPSAAAVATFLAARFFGVVAPSLASPAESLAAASKVVFLLTLGSATRSV